MPIFVLGLLSLSLGAYWYVNSVIEKELSKSMLQSAAKSAESINRWLATIMLEPETIASTPAAKKINQDFATLDAQNINRHKILHEKHPDIFQDIYAANSEGEYHTVQQKGGEYTLFVGNIQNRDYFQSIMAGGPTQITPPLISRTTGLPTIFMVSPIVDDGNQPQGLIGAGISLQYIQQIGDGLKAGRTGYGFIVAGDGTFIHHPQKESVMRHKITELDDSSERELGKRMISGGSGMLHYSRDSEDMVAFYHPVPISGWSVAMVLPEAELFAPAIRMITLLSVITALFIVLLGTAILVTMQRLTQPLQSLVGRVQEITDGNLEVADLEVRSQDEIGILSRSFNIMMANLKTTLSGLRQSEKQYRSIFENSLEGICQTTLQGRILNANPAMVRMLGYEGIAGALLADIDMLQQVYVNQDDRRKIVAMLLEQGKVQAQEVQFYRRNKDIIWISISALLVRDSLGAPLHIESFISDRSERKLAEQERENLQRQLAQAQKIESIGRLAGGVAHDFNNMLSVILGHTEIALKRIDTAHPLTNSLHEIHRAAERSADLTRQLLAFARKQTIAPQILDLNEVVDGMLKMLRRLIGEDIDLTWLPEKDLWPIKMDPSQIDQILVNVCVNARDAIAGVGKITIETRKAILDEAYCAANAGFVPGDYVLLAVSDDGCGMTKEAMGKLFEPFYTTKAMGQGTGLGLATVYGIVKQNDGFINIYSEPNQGSTFRIYLHRSEGERGKIRQETQGEVTVGGNETLLLVEDEPAILAMTTIMLESLGYTVLAAGTVSQALELAEQHADTISLLMTDVVMPEMTGPDLVNRLKSGGLHAQPLFMSGYTANVIAHHNVLDDGVQFIAKPFSMKDLAAKLREILDGQDCHEIVTADE